MSFKQLLVLYSISFNFNLIYSNPTEVLGNYQTYILKGKLNEKKHEYCDYETVHWAALCDCAFSKLREMKEYINNIYTNYTAFKDLEQNKCEMITLVLPNNEAVKQFHMPCPGRPKIVPAVLQSEQMINEVRPSDALTHEMSSESSHVSHEVKQIGLHDDYNKISIYPFQKRQIVVFKVNDEGKYNLFGWYKIHPRKLDETLLAKSLPKSTTHLFFLNMMLYSMSDNKLMIMSSSSKNIISSNSKIIQRTICNFVFARPEYGNYVPKTIWSIEDDQVNEENVLLFLTYIGNENYRIVDVCGYRCKEYPEKYRLLAGPDKYSLFVLEKCPIIDSQFVIHEFIEHLSIEHIFLAMGENITM